MILLPNDTFLLPDSKAVTYVSFTDEATQELQQAQWKNNPSRFADEVLKINATDNRNIFILLQKKIISV